MTVKNLLASEAGNKDEDILDGSSFKSVFQKVYFSHEIKLGKPDLEIFEKVLAENSLNHSTTFLIDDSPQHIEGARKAGVHAFPLQDGMETCD